MRKRFNAFLLLAILAPVLPIYAAAWLLGRAGDVALWLAEHSAVPFVFLHNLAARWLGEDEI